MNKDLTGQRFNRLVVIGTADDYISPNGHHHHRVVCRCDCGNTVTILKEYLTSGRQKSCGCMRKESQNRTHGEVKTRLYRIWGNMLNRCSNPNNPAWINYGARGISVCEEWHQYENFRDWALSNGYEDTLTLDRIDNNRLYEPSNCRWATIEQQANNKRTNVIISFNDMSMTLSEWSRYYNIPYKVLHDRIHRYKWDFQRAVTEPVNN